ncbi:TraX family protein [Ruminococcus albus]|uniref:TraX protein n=1 Tax=Ruminococcus albus TaxID=1264 RepID=A0A1I1FE73_RUMAL|nr:TraX family protein [Ruminococcus albus]SFB97262.1 TraX protein [Ruminococcus albus]
MQTNQKYKIIDRDMIKFIAIIPMSIGHFVDFYCGVSASLRNSLILFLLAQASLIASPIFFYFIAEGFRHTHSVKKYASRLFIFAVITQIPYCLMCNGTLVLSGMYTYLNVFFTLFLGLISLVVCESNLNLWAKIALVVILDAVTYLLKIQWLIFGIPIILILYYFKDRPTLRFSLFTLCSVGSLLITTLPAASLYYSKGLTEYFNLCIVGSVIDLCFLIAGYFIVTLFYNGEKGKNPAFTKWFFYIFYPAHLFLIYIVKTVAGKY